jgi:hypothetical protein
LRENALYVVRPDGHVALADPEADPQRLEAWFNRFSLSLGDGADFHGAHGAPRR